MFMEEGEEPQEVTTKSAAGVGRVKAARTDISMFTNSLMEGDATKPSDNLGEEARSASVLPYCTFLCPKPETQALPGPRQKAD